MRALGADVVFNYKAKSVAEVLAEHGPLDYYFDNVGGEQLDIALANMAMNGRIIVSLFVCFGWVNELIGYFL